MASRVEERADELTERASALWVEVAPDGRSAPEDVETLKPAHRKSGVVRLLGAGPEGEPVIAKRAARRSIDVEARVYRDVLARLPVSATRLLATAADGDHSWLFLEDAGEGPFESGEPGHRRLAAAWMARVHGGARELPEVAELPGRGPDHYRALLETVEPLLEETLSNPALSEEEVEVVEAALEACRAVAASWPQVAAALEASPSTITFGGFSSKNARVRADGGAPVLMPYDFESAGYGCPAIDLVLLDGPTYVREGRDWWEGLDIAEFERMQGIGRVLGAIKAIPGERKVLLCESPAKAVAKLRWYGIEMIGGLGAAGEGGA